MNKSLKQMAYDTIEVHQETIADLRTQLAKANEDYKTLFSAFESCQDELKESNERESVLSCQLDSHMERVRELMFNRGRFDQYALESEVMRKALLGKDRNSDTVSPRDLKQALNKFAIENQIKGLKDYQALCGFADCRESIDARIAQLEEKLRKEQE